MGSENWRLTGENWLFVFSFPCILLLLYIYFCISTSPFRMHLHCFHLKTCITSTVVTPFLEKQNTQRPQETLNDVLSVAWRCVFQKSPALVDPHSQLIPTPS